MCRVATLAVMRSVSLVITVCSVPKKYHHSDKSSTIQVYTFTFRRKRRLVIDTRGEGVLPMMAYARYMKGQGFP